jgi:hypothetical protein
MAMFLGVCGSHADPFPAQNDFGHSDKSPTAGVFPLLVSIGTTDPSGKVPVINGVKGADVSNIALAFPIGVLEHGKSYTVVMSTENGTFNGTCTDSYALVQSSGGSTSVLQSAKIHTFKCGAGQVFLWVINTAKIPNAKGAITLVGTVSFGKSQASIKVPMVIE